MGCLEGELSPEFSRRLGSRRSDDTLTQNQASKLAKEYEKQGGEYENEAGSKNEPKKGEPEAKSNSKKKAETED